MRDTETPRKFNNLAESLRVVVSTQQLYFSVLKVIK